MSEHRFKLQLPWGFRQRWIRARAWFRGGCGHFEVFSQQDLEGLFGAGVIWRKLRPGVRFRIYGRVWLYYGKTRWAWGWLTFVPDDTWHRFRLWWRTILAKWASWTALLRWDMTERERVRSYE